MSDIISLHSILPQLTQHKRKTSVQHSKDDKSYTNMKCRMKTKLSNKEIMDQKCTN